MRDTSVCVRERECVTVRVAGKRITEGEGSSELR